MKSARVFRTVKLDLALVFIGSALLVQPLFRAHYLNRWDSIESTFIADGRFLHEHWPHPQWQPFWYCGTRFDYIYPPALRYGVALLAGILAPAQAYHLFTAVLYCCGIAGVYFLVRVMSGSRGAGWLAAAASALVSPVFVLIPLARWISVYHTPWRLWVLLQYGEGPHISALSLLPFALAFAWLALEKRRLPALAAAALFCALVALTNFYGATALAIFYVALVWAAWVTWRDKRIWLRAAAIPALAYGLSAFWLTPSYLRLTIANLRLVSGAGRQWSAIALVALALLLILAAVRFRGYALFLTGSLLLFGFNVLGYVYFQRYITGDPWRLIPELDFAVILGCVEILRRLWKWSGKAQWHTRAARVLVMVAILGSLWSARHYVKRAWGDYLYPPTDYTQRVEYRLSEWMAGHFPQERSFVTGSTRLWWDTWRDLAQVEGGSDQGQLNPYLPDAEWNLTREANPETAVQWLLALGAGAAIVPFEKSQDAYHDFRFPHKFEGRLPMLYGDGQGNVIYRVPRRFPSLARVVDRDRLAGLPSLPLRTTSLDALHTYTALIEEGPDSPASMTWDGPDRLLVHAHMERGQSVLVQESYDPAWHAYLGRQAVPIYRDPIAFMRIDLPPGDQDLRLIFEMPFENRIGWSITFLSLVILAVLAAYGRQKAPSG